MTAGGPPFMVGIKAQESTLAITKTLPIPTKMRLYTSQ